jgi:hypothetical protein
MNKAKELAKTKRRLDKLWREAIMKNYGGACVVCGSTAKSLNCHHVITRRNQWGRWFIPNGLVLCPTHHKFSITCSAHQAPTGVFLCQGVFTFVELWDWFMALDEQTNGRGSFVFDEEQIEAHLKGIARGY